MLQVPDFEHHILLVPVECLRSSVTQVDVLHSSGFDVLHSSGFDALHSSDTFIFMRSTTLIFAATNGGSGHITAFNLGTQRQLEIQNAQVAMQNQMLMKQMAANQNQNYGGEQS
jgi:hypothetical protein